MPQHGVEATASWKHTMEAEAMALGPPDTRWMLQFVSTYVHLPCGTKPEHRCCRFPFPVIIH